MKKSNEIAEGCKVQLVRGIPKLIGKIGEVTGVCNEVEKRTGKPCTLYEVMIGGKRIGGLSTNFIKCI